MLQAWSYSIGKDVLGKRREGKTGPHHNLPHYHSEFNGVGSEVVEWTPYKNFEEADVVGEEGDEGMNMQFMEARVTRAG